MSDAGDSVTIHDEDEILGGDDDKNANGSDLGNDDLGGGGDDGSMDDPDLEAIRARVREMEEEAAKLKQMQSEWKNK